MCGLRAIYVKCGCVDFVSYMCCWPSSRLFFCRFSKPPRAGRFCRNFVLTVLFFCRSISRGVRTRPLLLAAGGRLVLMATRVRNTRGLVAIRSMATLGCLAALLRVPVPVPVRARAGHVGAVDRWELSTPWGAFTLVGVARWGLGTRRRPQ